MLLPISSISLINIETEYKQVRFSIEVEPMIWPFRTLGENRKWNDLARQIEAAPTGTAKVLCMSIRMSDIHFWADLGCFHQKCGRAGISDRVSLFPVINHHHKSQPSRP